MNSLYFTIKKIAIISWLRLKRSRYLRARLISLFINSTTFFYIIAISVFAGIYLEEILFKLFPYRSPLSTINSYLPLIIVGSAAVRLVIQGKQSWNITPYLQWPIPKKQLTIVYIFGNFFNRYTLSFILFFVVLAVDLAYSNYFYVDILNISIGAIFILLSSELFLLIIRIDNVKKEYAIYFILYNIIIYGIIIYYFNHHYIYLLISSIINLYIINFIISKNIYSKNINYKNNILYNKIFCKEPYYTIILKSIFRNSIYRKTLFYYFILIIGGAVFLTSIEQIQNFLFLIMVMLICTGSLVSNLIITYLFSWDFNWRGFIFSKPLEIKDYIKANLLFSAILTLIPFLFYYVIYLINDDKLFLLASSFSLFLIPINYIQSLFSLIYYKNKDPNFFIFDNAQPGRALIFVLLCIPTYIIYHYNGISVDTKGIEPITFYLIGGIGLVILLISPILFKYFYAYFSQRKYFMLN